MSHKTIHAAKGSEAKIVFIVGLTDGKGGFPDVWLEDRIFQIVKQANVELLLEEERRLFYVAITRAKEQLFLITERGMESRFLKEIPELYVVKADQATKCPKCNHEIEVNWRRCPHCE